jgi:NADH-quinone oxidoreductase subunit A
MTPLVAYTLLFVAIGIGFIFVHLLAGMLIRPRKPGPEKGTIYECGEPTIGSAWIQFDLRFYVVALLFVIFDVEVAFFFPWAVVFGKANDLANTPPTDYVAVTNKALELVPPNKKQRERTLLSRAVPKKDQEEAETEEQKQQQEEQKEQALTKLAEYRDQAPSLGKLAFVEILVFFGVLLVGFAYLWKRGDVAWVRSLAAEEPPPGSAS